LEYANLSKKYKPFAFPEVSTLSRILFLVLQLVSLNTTALAAPKPQSFLLDPSKPYTYLKFDHVGERQPIPGEERAQGLWLRLVNNCRIPIVVATFNYGEGTSSVGVYHEVVRVTRKGVPNSPDSSQTEPPSGYPLSELIETTTIAPGANLLFSVPLDHVGPFWYLQVRFYFELPNDPYGFGPYSVVSFYRQDIPEKFRER
jgi:hypothetical protein